MPQGMAQQGQLAMIEPVHALQSPLQGAHLAGFALQIGMQVGDGLLDHLHLGQKEVGEVVVVAFTQQERALVLPPGLVDRRGNRNELEQPVALIEHRPIEERPGRTAVSIAEGVVVGQPEVQGDGPDHRMEKHSRGLAVSKAAEQLQALLQLAGRRRHVEHRSVGVVHHNVLAKRAQPAGVSRIIQRVLTHQPVEIQHQLRRQGLILELPDALHCPVVVEDHLLGAIPGRTAAADHGLGHIPRRRRTLHLGGGDRLLHQRAQQVAISSGGSGDGFRGHHAGACLHVDLMKALEQHRRLAEPEGTAVAAQQSQRNACAPASKLLGEPPLPMAEPLRRLTMMQLIPVEIAIPLRGCGQLRKHGHGLLQPAALGEQFLHRRRPAGQTGWQLPTNS